VKFFFLLGAAVLLLAALPWAGAAEPQKPADPSMAEEVLDVIYLGETRPVLMRLHLLTDGKPFDARWNAYLRKLFDFLDRDENGFLDKTEAQLMPGAQQLQMQFQGNPYYLNNFPPPAFSELDANGDGKVSFEEFTAYYRKNNLGAIQVTSIAGAGNQANTLTDVIFKALDTDKDGKLSKAELQAAHRILSKFDENDDEVVTAQELLGGNQFGGIRQRQLPQPVPGMSAQQAAPLLLVPREEPGNRLGARLKIAKDVLARYDKDKDGKLTREEIGFSSDLFETLGPSDGALTATKLLRWLLVLPDVEMTVRLGQLGPKQAHVEMTEVAGRKTPPMPFRKSAYNSVVTTLGKTHFTVSRLEGTSIDYGANIRQFYLQQFKAADTKQQGFVREKDLQNQQFLYLKSLLKVADRDEDGKLTEKEIVAWVDLVSSASNCQTTLSYVELGQGLFELLDANKDGRLSARELRTAWNRLAEFDTEKEGFLTRAMLPRQCQVLVYQGGANNAYALAFAQPGVLNPNVRVSPGQGLRGPEWFRKMDTNGDGDVSEREFLGSPEDFKRIDTDGDGYITVEEAERADAWFREKLRLQEKKPAKK
jgi:Ca2+-binding EF-hand superfamily protein